MLLVKVALVFSFAEPEKVESLIYLSAGLFVRDRVFSLTSHIFSFHHHKEKGRKNKLHKVLLHIVMSLLAEKFS